jgi:hypothetical protein
MSMRYKIYRDRNLLVDVLENNITLKELEKSFLVEINDENFKEVHKVLSNIQNAHLLVDVEEIYQFIKLMMTPNPDPAFRWAILTNSPNQVALSYLIMEDPYFHNVVGVFSTLEGCKNFLDVSFRREEFLDEDYIMM